LRVYRIIVFGRSQAVDASLHHTLIITTNGLIQMSSHDHIHQHRGFTALIGLLFVAFVEGIVSFA